MEIKNIIREFFLKYPTKKIHLRELSRELDISLPMIIRYTKELEKENIITSEKISNIYRYQADKSSSEFLFQKKIFNLKELHNSKLIEFLKIELSDPAIILFGSYSRGEDIEKSDIDIYVETSENIPKLDQFENILDKKIQIFKYENIKKMKNKDLANNIINGITLNGYIEVI